jgi:hypothetical protein
MDIIRKKWRHAAIFRGDFSDMFKGLEVPPLPLVITRLIKETNKKNPSLDVLVRLISSRRDTVGTKKYS